MIKNQNNALTTDLSPSFISCRRGAVMVNVHTAEHVYSYQPVSRILKLTTVSIGVIKGLTVSNSRYIFL